MQASLASFVVGHCPVSWLLDLKIALHRTTAVGGCNQHAVFVGAANSHMVFMIKHYLELPITKLSSFFSVPFSLLSSPTQPPSALLVIGHRCLVSWLLDLKIVLHRTAAVGGRNRWAVCVGAGADSHAVDKGFQPHPWHWQMMSVSRTTPAGPCPSSAASPSPLEDEKDPPSPPLPRCKGSTSLGGSWRIKPKSLTLSDALAGDDSSS